MPPILQKTQRPLTGYSATVEIELHTAAGVHYPTQTAHDRLLFSKPIALEPSVARLVITIDGEPQESTIEILPYEVPSDRVPVRIVRPSSAGWIKLPMASQSKPWELASMETPNRVIWEINLQAIPLPGGFNAIKLNPPLPGNKFLRQCLSSFQYSRIRLNFGRPASQRSQPFLQKIRHGIPESLIFMHCQYL
jgi:hypothetical protein